MKLATALSERADIQRKISELKTRLEHNAKVQEGESPAEKPDELLKELNDCFERLEELIARINYTNNLVKKDGRSLTDLIAKRDCLTLKVSILRKFLNEASAQVDRYSRTEIKILRTIDVEKMQKEVDSISRDLRETGELIQELNWTNELM